MSVGFVPFKALGPAVSQHNFSKVVRVMWKEKKRKTYKMFMLLGRRKTPVELPVITAGCCLCSFQDGQGSLRLCSCGQRRNLHVPSANGDSSTKLFHFQILQFHWVPKVALLVKVDTITMIPKVLCWWKEESFRKFKFKNLSLWTSKDRKCI